MALVNDRLFRDEVLSSSESEESYKDKFENVKGVVQQLQKDLHSEKVRNKGIRTIVEALEEKRADNVALQELVTHQRRELAVLQNRLQMVGESKSTQLKESETIQPNPPKPRLESVLMENSRMQQQLKFMNIDPQKMEQLLKDVKEQKQQIQIEQEKNARLQSQLLLVKKQMKSNEKDDIILKLREEMATMERNRNTQNVLCQSLSEETTNLRQQLRDTMTQMQQIMCQMDDHDRKKSADGIALNASCVLPGNSQQLQMLQKENDELTRTSTEQAVKLKEVIEMNNHWQRYNQQRDQHVQSLQKTLNDMKLSSAKKSETPSKAAVMLSTSQQERIDQTILQYKKKVQQAEDGKLLEADECRKLRQHVARL